MVWSCEDIILKIVYNPDDEYNNKTQNCIT